MEGASALRVLRERLGYSEFRGSQQEICQWIAEGRDALVVMPTGAGKSLCYQLPGLLRGGTTLVVSPLVALMEDQVSKLTARGIRVEAIHSGRGRDESRAACIQYLKGELEFLLIAPERLAVPGFPEMLQKRRPTLIAIDEAHCISQWGHDFRSEYRRLSERLKPLRPAPVVALTATATPSVQRDILEQLGIPEARKFIQGFRRTNIAIEVHEAGLSDRASACSKILSEKGRLPAIIYAPTRKSAEEISAELSRLARGKFRTQWYHAGLDSESRDRVQQQFQSGKIDVMVATIAFGMGIDVSNIRTVVHAGLSGSVEAYYQEIGRAGRDGLPSRAVLLHSFSDQRTQEFFFERDYPEVDVLERLFNALVLRGPALLTALSRSKFLESSERDSDRSLELQEVSGVLESLSSSAGLSLATLERALELLRLHGAFELSKGTGNRNWRLSYQGQRGHRQEALNRMLDFTRSTSCRMSYFLRYFGDADSAGVCGICDRCVGAHTPDSGRPLRAIEKEAVVLALRVLSGWWPEEKRYREARERALPSFGLSLGRLLDGVQEHSGAALSRQSFEPLIEIIASAGWVTLSRESFVNEQGKRISYRKVELTEKGARVLVELGTQSRAKDRAHGKNLGKEPHWDGLRISEPMFASVKKTRRRASRRVSTSRRDERQSSRAEI